MLFIVITYFKFLNLNGTDQHFLLACKPTELPGSTHPGHPSVGTSQRTVMLCGWGVKAGMACV